MGTGAVDHQIALQNFDATQLGGSDIEIISRLLAGGKLITNA